MPFSFFEYKSKKYNLDSFDFQFCTFLGACTVPFGFVTAWELTGSIMASLLSASLILCGNYFISPPEDFHTIKSVFVRYLVIYRCRHGDTESVYSA